VSMIKLTITCSSHVAVPESAGAGRQFAIATRGRTSVEQAVLRKR